MRLSDQQIRDTVALMDMSERSKRALVKAALDGHGASRFLVHHHYRRQNPSLPPTEGTGLYAQWLAQNGVAQ